MTYLAAVTRDIWAFSRDQGLPFSTLLSHIDKKRRIPVRATLLTSLISIGLSLIYIGSPVAFYGEFPSKSESEQSNIVLSQAAAAVQDPYPQVKTIPST